MGFLSKFTKETHWKSLNFQNVPTISWFRIFRDTFLRDEKIIFFRKNNFLTQNLSRNPKIILREPCDHSKDAKNQKIPFFLLFAIQYRPARMITRKNDQFARRRRNKIPARMISRKWSKTRRRREKIFPQEWLVKMISLELKKLSRKNDWKNDCYVIQNAIIRAPQTLPLFRWVVSTQVRNTTVLGYSSGHRLDRGLSQQRWLDRNHAPFPALSNSFEHRGNKGRATRLQVRTCLPTDSAFWPRVLDRKARSGCGLVSANKNVWWEQTLSVHWVGKN